MTTPDFAHDYNPFVPPQRDDPYPIWAEARRQCPVFYSEVQGAWIVTRYTDICTVLRDTDRFSTADVFRPARPEAEVQAVLQQGYAYDDMPGLLATAPPRHTRLRRVANAAFTLQRVAAMEPHIRDIANRLVDGFVGDGQADMVARLAYPLPLTVIMELLGVPAADRATVHGWSDDRAMLLWGEAPVAQQVAAARGYVDSQRYFAALVEERRANPKDDLISAMATLRLDGEPPLSTSELVGEMISYLSAGHETTTGHIGNALILLLGNREQWERLRADLTLAASAIEETLRMHAPVRGITRTTTQAVELGGVRIPSGARLEIMFASGNHDETTFQDPDRFDLTRRQEPHHLSFGHGIHFCLGAPLARLEGRIALEILATRLPNLRLEPDQAITYRPSVVFYLPTSLPLRWDC